MSLAHPVDQLAAQMVAQASLCARAGADIDKVGQWITLGEKRGEAIDVSRRTPRL